MLRALEAMIDERGNVRLMESIHLPALRRALVIILEEEPALSVSETALLSELARLESKRFEQEYDKPIAPVEEFDNLFRSALDEV